MHAKTLVVKRRILVISRQLGTSKRTRSDHDVSDLRVGKALETCPSFRLGILSWATVKCFFWARLFSEFPVVLNALKSEVQNFRVPSFQRGMWCETVWWSGLCPYIDFVVLKRLNLIISYSIHSSMSQLSEFPWLSSRQKIMVCSFPSVFISLCISN
jgi:hypothetical protein